MAGLCMVPLLVSCRKKQLYVMWFMNLAFLCLKLLFVRVGPFELLYTETGGDQKDKTYSWYKTNHGIKPPNTR